jgi:hypothetical protein
MKGPAHRSGTRPVATRSDTRHVRSRGSMPWARAALALSGLAVGGFGGYRFVEVGWPNARAALVWLIGGVVAHDGLLAPAVLLLCAAGATALPRWSRGPAIAALVVLGSVTLAGIPVLGRFGARADNRTLLDRPYLAGWLVLAGLVLSTAVIAAVVRRREGAADRG